MATENIILVATYPKVGMMVTVGGYDDNAPQEEQDFVDSNYGKLFKITHVGNWSCELEDVPFMVKFKWIYHVMHDKEVQ